MSGNGNGAYELRHCGKIYRASEFSELKEWVQESRVTAEDYFRAAGSDQWIPVMEEPEFALILNPDSQWTVTMGGSDFKTSRFETIVQWSEEGRISEDAVVEGPRTPPGGVQAVALPALASHLRKLQPEKLNRPVLRIDGREFPASDTDTIRAWIRASRVPVEAEISLDGSGWEPVSRCGLFDLEDWPQAAHGRIEEESLPEMPVKEFTGSGIDKKAAVQGAEQITETATSLSNQPTDEAEDTDESAFENTRIEDAAYTVVSGNSEITIESLIKLRRLLKNRMIYSYDEIRHPSISEEAISVGEYLDSLQSNGKKTAFWILWGVAGSAAVVAALEYFSILDLVAWL